MCISTPSLPVELIPNRNGDYTRTTTSPRCVEKTRVATLVDVQIVHAGGQDQNAKKRIAAAKENVQSLNETELPVNRTPCPLYLR